MPIIRVLLTNGDQLDDLKAAAGEAESIAEALVLRGSQRTYDDGATEFIPAHQIASVWVLPEDAS